MKFKIDNEIFEKYPGLNIGIVVVKGINNKGENAEVLSLLNNVQEEVRGRYVASELSQHPKISAWRKAYSSFGAKPKKYKSSIEALIKRVLMEKPVNHINTLVDIYNYLSLKYAMPMGADNLDKVEGNVRLDFTKGDEKYVELGATEVKNPKPGEVAYFDDKEVLCRRWNWRECDKTKLTEDTTNVILYVEGLPPVAKEEVENAINELSNIVQKYCGGEVSQHVLNVENPEVIVI